VRLHLLICTACTRFKQQVEFLQRAGRQYANRGMQAAAQQWRLSASARARIEKALADHR
jgi:hypothetical protein